MMRENLVLFGEPICIECLDGQRDDPVQFLTSLNEQGTVCDVMGESMLEDVSQFGGKSLFVDESHGL